MKKKILLLTLLFIHLFLLTQEFDFELYKPENLYIGTPLQMKMEVYTGLNDSIFVPQIDTLDIFVLKPPIKSTEEKIDNGKKTTILFTFLPFDTGEHLFPEMEISVRSKGELKTYQTIAIPLFIESVLTDSSFSIRDIAAPIHLRLGFWDYMAIILLLAFLVLIVYILRKLLRKKPSIAQEPIITDTRPPYQKALELLVQMKDKKLLENGKFLQLHFELSYILRFFVEHQYSIHAMEMTTSEIREHLALDDSKEKSEILAFLNFADKIKFAKFIPEYEQSNEAIDWLEHYLHSFKNVNNGESKNA